MAEGARLESVYTGNRIVGSNPTPSAMTSGVRPGDMGLARLRSRRIECMCGVPHRRPGAHCRAAARWHLPEAGLARRRVG